VQQKLERLLIFHGGETTPEWFRMMRAVFDLQGIVPIEIAPRPLQRLTKQRQDYLDRTVRRSFVSVIKVDTLNAVKEALFMMEVFMSYSRRNRQYLIILIDPALIYEYREMPWWKIKRHRGWYAMNRLMRKFNGLFGSSGWLLITANLKKCEEKVKDALISAQTDKRLDDTRDPDLLLDADGNVIPLNHPAWEQPTVRRE
jgi:hypothetical protein